MISILLYPISLIYSLIIAFRNKLYDFKIFRYSEFDIPIINVGNISVGGNGKTPQVEYIAELLQDNYNIAILSRGYGRKSKGFREVAINDLASESGDEPLQMKNTFQEKVSVFVGENRVEAITKILFQYPETELIILDDAFQHRAIKAGLNLLLTDYNSLFVNDKMLPLGHLRESKKGAKRAHLIVVTKCPDTIDIHRKNEIRNQLSAYCSQIVFSKLQYGEMFNLFETKDKESAIINERFITVSAIAKPKPFEEYSEKKFNVVGKMSFRDHHRFSSSNIDAIEKKIHSFAPLEIQVLTTAKDATRFKEFFLKKKLSFKVKVLPIRAHFDDYEKEYFENLIMEYVRENTRNS